MFNNKKLMITGGTGSFGTATLERFLKTDVAEIRIFSRDEKKQEEMRLRFNDARLRFYIGDVRDYHSVNQALYGVDFVFHAAALKQVPSCEFYPLEAIKTNVLGTENVLDAAIANDVKKVVVLSTDKAVYPINAMGMTKALAEKLVVAKARLHAGSGPIICCTRYGNVMASRGSVIPLFLQQVLTRQALTVTDPNMTRFLMTLEESVELVLYAFEHADSGDICVQKSPAARMDVLANAICSLLNVDNEVKIIGTRHGEKLYETLISREEMVRASQCNKYFKIPADNRDLNYQTFFDEGEINITEMDDYTSHNTSRLDLESVKQLLSTLPIIKEHLHV